MKSKVGHTSSTILNSCSFQRYRLLLPVHWDIFKLTPFICIFPMISKGSRAGKYNFAVPIFFFIVCSVYIVWTSVCQWARLPTNGLKLHYSYKHSVTQPPSFSANVIYHHHSTLNYTNLISNKPRILFLDILRISLYTLLPQKC